MPLKVLVLDDDLPKPFTATRLQVLAGRQQPPDAVIAVHRTNGTQDRSRPLCPYPKTAAYKGKDDTNNAANFGCR